MSEPRLSVLITTFNRPQLVQEAIASVLAQDAGPPFEILVVDDGSSAETRDALRRFDGVIRYVRQENRGLNAARNHGLRLVEGDLVAILDDDDVWLPFKTRALLPALARFPQAGFVHSNFVVWSPATGERRPDGLRRWFPRAFAWDEIYRERAEVAVPATSAADAGEAPRVVEAWLGDLYYWSLYSPMVLPSTSIVRRGALGEGVGFIEENHVGDWEFFARLSHRCGAVFVPLETTLNRSHDDRYRLTRADPRQRVGRRLGMIERLWRADPAFVAAHGAELDRVEADCLRQLARVSVAAGEAGAAREALRALRRLPGQARPADLLLRAAAALPGAATAISLLRWIRRPLPARAKTGF
jgi:glycosyltransferase involved in cell wall biosynthesis